MEHVAAIEKSAIESWGMEGRALMLSTYNGSLLWNISLVLKVYMTELLLFAWSCVHVVLVQKSKKYNCQILLPLGTTTTLLKIV